MDPSDPHSLEAARDASRSASAPGSAPPTKKSARPLFWVGVAGVGCVGVLAVIGLIGILSAVAIPSFSRYTRRAKTSEARANLHALAASVENACRSRGTLPGAAGPVPPVPGPRPQHGDFASDPVFQGLGFAPSDPVRYSYRIVPNARGGVDLVAHGDLDGDGVQSTFTIACRPSCDCDPLPDIEDATE